MTLLESSFMHLTGVGPKRECSLWSAGILTWADLLRRRHPGLFALIDGGGDELERSRQALDEEDADWFAARLPRQEHWRVAAAFPERTMFLDIETTGLSRYYHVITLVGWGLGRCYGAFLPGDDPAELSAMLKEAKAIVTFNGSSFDLPFIRSVIPSVYFPVAHIDLRHAGRRFGLSGTQKEVERSLGVRRPKDVDGMDGSAAPQLWRQYERGDLRSLRMLVTYNHSDIQGMRAILKVVANSAAERAGFPRWRAGKTLWQRPALKFAPGDGSPGTSGFLALRPWTGRVGPRIKFSDLPTPPLRPLRRVVGIDLTGSHRRPSGWALLDANVVETARIAADDELLDRTLGSEPDLISIDAPLSLPRGRLTVEDDDPTRDDFGITRECERILKRRGVNTYPCLIRSMQALTKRGIHLAKCFRTEGVPVIESFPGAMQDILGIPRKRDSLRWLKQGLIEYGLDGQFAVNEVSHDELDAICSAIVGQLAWTGLVERLGNDSEGHLLIPSVSGMGTDYLRIVGLSGRTGSGKTTAAAILAELGYILLSPRKVLAAMLRARSEEPTRPALQQLGEEVHHHYGQRWLLDKVARGVGTSGCYVIDGLRFPEDHAYLIERFGGSFLHIHVEAPDPLRRSRFIARGGTNGEFDCAEQHVTESKTTAMRRLAHRVVVNESSSTGTFSRVG